jgi:phosphatidate cytidylyltransferase
MPSAPHMRSPSPLHLLSHWITRPLFGTLLAALLVGADFAGGAYFAVLIGIGAVFAAREWHRMVAAQVFIAETVAAALFLALALASLTLWPHSLLALGVLALGAIVLAGLSRLQHERPVWQAGGLLYIGIPALALVAVRTIPPHGAWLIVGLFLIVWGTDTGALIAGNLIGGPKLAPVLSPNKTWAGTLGGVVAAAGLEALYIGVLGGSVAGALLFGAGISVVAHAGDLFESWVKRRFRKKDSGSLIPGHGGALDRIDSTLSASTALAVLVLFFQLDPLFGAHP